MQVPHHLVEQIRAGKVVLFLGAGASRGAKSPQAPIDPPPGKELGRLLWKKFLGDAPEDKSLMVIGEYCITETDLRTVQQYIAEIFGRFVPSSTQKAISDFKWAALVTTNYDQIIERAYAENPNRLQQPVAILRTTDRVDHELRAPNTVALLKLHGCISMANEVQYPMILTIDQYITHRQGREKLFSRFQEYAGEYSVLYVGYQIEDPDLRAILLELTSADMSRPRHYVVTPHPSDRDVRMWEKKNIQALAGTFDEFMEELQKQIPSALRGASFTAITHPIAKKFVSHDVPSEDLLAFLENDAMYLFPGMTSDAPNAHAFFRGASYGWSAIIAGYDAKRNLTDTILSEVILLDESSRPRTSDFYLIKGYAGTGKTVFLKRIAYEAAVTFEKSVLYLRSDARLNIGPITELCRLLGERLYLFIDGVSRRGGEVAAFIRAARTAKLALTIISAERTNEWNVDGGELSSLLDESHQLRALSLLEIDGILQKLEEFNCLGDLQNKDTDQRRQAFLSYADRQLLVALYEITSGAEFPDIVFNEYRNISSDRARRIYLVVCALNRMNVPVRAGLVHRLTGVSFTEFKRDFFGPLESIVLTEEYKPALDMAYRARHPWVAQIVFERALPMEADRFDLYISILKEIDIGYTPDRAAFRESIRARNLRELFSEPLRVEEIYKVAETASPDDGYHYQQWAIYEMKRVNPNLRRAYDLLSHARTLMPHDRSITHTISELEMLRGASAKTEVERKLHLEQARQYAVSLTGANSDSGHGYVTLVKLAMDRLRDALQKGNLDDEDVTALTKEVEQVLTSGLQKFGNDEYLLAAEADFSHLLNNDERATKALTKAIVKNPSSAFVARSLARLLEAKGDVGEARRVLDGALRVAPGDKALNASLAGLLERSFPAETSTAEKCWRRSFTEGDTNYSSQFKYARRLYLNDKAEDSLVVFSRLKLARVPFDEKVAISGHIRDNGKLRMFEGTVTHMEADHAWITPFGQQRTIYLHYSNVDGPKWLSLRRGDAVSFHIGFNFMGPAATMKAGYQARL